MSLNVPFGGLSRLHYDPADYNDIIPYAEAFEQIRSKIGQDFSLRKIGEGTRGNVFEIYQKEKGVYVLKLPRPNYLGDERSDIIEKVRNEIALQKKFTLRYEELVKHYHKERLSYTTQQTSGDLYGNLSSNEIFSGEKHSVLSMNPKRDNEDIAKRKEVFRKRYLLTRIKIPRLLEVYQGEMPIIIMDKIPGKSLWFEIISSALSPFFYKKWKFSGDKHSFLKSSGKTLYQNCVDDDLNDKDIAAQLRAIEEVFTTQYGKRQVQEDMINSGLLEEYPDLTVCDFIAEVDSTPKPPEGVFLQLYDYGEEKAFRDLQDAYDFFVSDFGIQHPDPNLYNFIITPNKELGIIDFG